MARLLSLAAVAIVASFALTIRTALGEISCENLPPRYCAFSISSKGMRCVLEKNVVAGRRVVKYECKTSDVYVPNMCDWIETTKCIKACGVQRKSLGISSDLLFQPKFIRKLCSPRCYYQCPNIVDLFFNLAAGEGLYLPKLCKRHRHGHEHQPYVEGPTPATTWPPPSQAPAAQPPAADQWPSYNPPPAEAPIDIGDLPALETPSISPAESPIYFGAPPEVIAGEPYPFDDPPFPEEPSWPPAP